MKPQRPSSSEGIQIKWNDLPLTTARSVTNSEFIVHPADQVAKEVAKGIKQYASQTSIQFAHADADGKTADDRLRSITKAHFATPQDAGARILNRPKAPPPNRLWESEFVDQARSISKVFHTVVFPRIHSNRTNERCRATTWTPRRWTRCASSTFSKAS